MQRRTQVGLWIVIAVLSVTTLILYVDNKRTRDCIAEYMTKDSQNTSNRTAIVDTERDAFLELLKVLGNPKTDQKARKEVYEGYIDLVDRDNILREQNPVLPVPTECN